MTIGSSFIIFVEKVLFWGETTFLDSALYFFRALFVGEWQSSGFVSSSYGLRQGDPLFSLLFVIVIEALSKMLSVTVNGGSFSQAYLWGLELWSD